MTAGVVKDRQAIVLGVNADIGYGVAQRLLNDGWSVAGIARSSRATPYFNSDARFKLLTCDLADNASVDRMVSELRTQARDWSLFFSAAGTMEPIGAFLTRDFDAWENSIAINSTAQLRVLHGAWPSRSPDSLIDVAFLAGGGTNGPFRNYSAYCLAKILLIKACELLDDEEPSCNAFIIGPGFVRTRIHAETLRAGEAAGPGLSKTRAFLDTPGTSLDDIYDHLRWCMMKGRSVAGGRNFSTVHDDWRYGGQSLVDNIIGDKDALRLRRHSGKSI